MQISFNLNGTDANPFARMGLRQNPFPTLPREYAGAELHLYALGGDPIPHAEPGQAEAHIREHLKGFDPEFINGCVKAFVPGQVITITVTWPDTRD